MPHHQERPNASGGDEGTPKSDEIVGEGRIEEIQQKKWRALSGTRNSLLVRKSDSAKRAPRLRGYGATQMSYENRKNEGSSA